MTEIGDFIKAKREAKDDLSQRKLAYLAKVSNTEISRIESGDRPNPSPEILKKIAPHIGVAPNILMEIAGYLEADGTNKASGETTAAEKPGVYEQSGVSDEDVKFTEFMQRAGTSLDDEEKRSLMDLAKIFMQRTGGSGAKKK